MQNLKLFLIAPFAAAAVIAACGGDKPTPPASPTDMVAEAGADMPSTPDTSSAAAAASAAPTDTAMAAPSATPAPTDTAMAASTDVVDAGAADGHKKAKKAGKKASK